MSVSAGGVRDQQRWNADVVALRQPAFTVIDRIDGVKPGLQLDAVAVALVAMAEAVGLDPHEVVSKARRMLADVDGPFVPQIKAIREYAQHEIGRKAGPSSLHLNAR